MREFWPKEAVAMWQTADWWWNTLGGSVHLALSGIKEMQCFQQAWADWLETDNEFAVADRAMMAADNGRYMNLLAIHGTSTSHQPPSRSC
ncbi:MAG: hypothetical protein ACOC0D_02725 [Spirochaeta sp.]